jgi:hypothetical protein
VTLYVAPGATFEAVLTKATSLAGTLGVRISEMVAGVDTVARVTAGITQYPAASGIYKKALVAPSVASSATVEYQIIWDDTVTFTAEELVVTYTAPSPPITGPDLCTLADVKLAVGIPTLTTTSDTLINALIPEVTRAFKSRFQREFAPPSGNPLTRRFRVDGNIVDLAPYDLQAVSGAGVVLDPAGTPTTLVVLTDYKLKPEPTMSGTYYKLHLAQSRYLWSQTVMDYGYAEVDITGTWGFASVPVDVNRAAALTVGAWMDRGSDVIAQMDNNVRPDGSTFASSWAIPTAAYRLMQPYIRVIP